MAPMCVVAVRNDRETIYTLLHPHCLRERHHTSVHLRQIGKFLRVAACRSAIQYADRDAVVTRPPRESEGRIDCERSADAEETISAVKRRRARLDSILRNDVSEERHSGLDEAATGAARGDVVEARDVVDRRVGVRPERLGSITRRADHASISRVARRQRGVILAATRLCSARHALDPIATPVEGYHVPRARGLVKTVDVLGDDLVDDARGLELSNCEVRVVWLRRRKCGITD